jgi:hypothetical protein
VHSKTFRPGPLPNGAMLIVSSMAAPHFSHFKIIAMTRRFTGFFRLYCQCLAIKEVRRRRLRPLRRIAGHKSCSLFFDVSGTVRR